MYIHFAESIGKNTDNTVTTEKINQNSRATN